MTRAPLTAFRNCKFFALILKNAVELSILEREINRLIRRGHPAINSILVQFRLSCQYDVRSSRPVVLHKDAIWPYVPYLRLDQQNIVATLL